MNLCWKYSSKSFKFSIFHLNSYLQRKKSKFQLINPFNPSEKSTKENIFNGESLCFFPSVFVVRPRGWQAKNKKRKKKRLPLSILGTTKLSHLIQFLVRADDLVESNKSWGLTRQDFRNIFYQFGQHFSFFVNFWKCWRSKIFAKLEFI